MGLLYEDKDGYQGIEYKGYHIVIEPVLFSEIKKIGLYRLSDLSLVCPKIKASSKKEIYKYITLLQVLVDALAN